MQAVKAHDVRRPLARGRRVPLWIACGLLLAVLALLVAAQLVLPGIAAQRLRARLARHGTVQSVEVDAFPAVELLWGHADRVVVRLGEYHSSTGQAGTLLAQAGRAGSVEVSADEVDVGLLRLHDATLTKRGDQLSARAFVSEGDLRAAVPFLDGVVPVASGGGSLTLQGTATAFGITASADATVSAQDGQLVVVPDIPFGGLAQFTLFADPRLAVQDVGAAPAPGGFAVFAHGRLR